MKRFYFNIKRGLVLLMIISPFFSIGQEKKEKYRFRPNYVKAQYAGDIACISAGVGYSYSENRWETEMLLGYVPKGLRDNGFVTFTLKQNYIPWSVNVVKDKGIYFIPLTCALAVNIAFDPDLGLPNLANYDGGYGYYGFDPSIHFNLMLGQRIVVKRPFCKKGKRDIAIYYEIGSNELTIINAIRNSSLRPREYLNLGLGLIFTI